MTKRWYVEVDNRWDAETEGPGAVEAAKAAFTSQKITRAEWAGEDDDDNGRYFTVVYVETADGQGHTCHVHAR